VYTYKFIQVDAFTTKRLGGNPCAILFDTDEMDSATMLAVAKEMNLSETSFVRSSDIADYGVRYFTPAEEIPLAGHPTIATVHALVETGMVKLTDERTVITLELQVGPIEVEVFSRKGEDRLIVMCQQKPKFLNTHDPADVMPVFGLKYSDLFVGATIQTVSTGTPQLMVPLKNMDVLKRVRLDIPAYQELRENSDFFSPHLFVLQGIEHGDTFARHFGVPPDTPEDPFTGSATGGMAAYLWHYGLIDNPVFIAEQGHWMGRPGTASVEVIGSRQNIEAVKVGGSAITVLNGEFYI
jgi:trans-2,3-dihydro-3-hydroxyanthranilate isomerase